MVAIREGRLRAADHPWLTFEYLGMPEYRERSAVGLLAGHRLYKAGFLVNVCGHDWSVLRLQPPLDTGSERLAAFDVPSCAYNVLYRERDSRFMKVPRPPLHALGPGRK